MEKHYRQRQLAGIIPSRPSVQEAKEEEFYANTELAPGNHHLKAFEYGPIHMLQSRGDFVTVGPEPDRLDETDDE